MNTQKVWFVSRASKGLGLALVKKLLAEGFRVAATSRSLPDVVKEAGAASGNFLPLKMDVINESSVEEAIQKTIAHFKTIDVVVNNAGYGLLKTLTGQSTQQHIHDKLIEKAKEKLSTTDLMVSEIAYELGFEHPQSFGKLFKTKTNLSPLGFRQSFN